MKLENQVCTLEQAKKLKKYGIAQTSEFLMRTFPFNKDRDGELIRYVHTPYPLPESYFAAFTVAELGVMLGDSHPSWSFKKPGADETLFISTMIGPNDPLAKHKYKDADLIPMNTYGCCDRYAATEAESRAQLLIALIECEAPTFSIDEINKRLIEA